MPITFTLDLEDHRAGASGSLRCAPPTQMFLSWLENQGARATVFVVGQLGELPAMNLRTPSRDSAAPLQVSVP